ncbi:hypothetical protein J7E24_10685 [Hymenobacter sp. ISL-91]|uniref:hypothetical protein n=1 Tax=Hymenobacter sp. ISL-91 TaxID=2819151 RepID=UPI001BE79A71|nr:hypothetical protein [Hymenobacter sp. ISL-91]MBT2558252.1 hypothetical protein [Hymenobacter sp. ISL-91]
MTRNKRLTTAEKAIDSGELTPLQIWLPATVDVAQLRTEFSAWATDKRFYNSTGVALEDECLHVLSLFALSANLTIYRSKKANEVYKDGSGIVTRLTELGYHSASRDQLYKQFGKSYAKHIDFLTEHNYVEWYSFYDEEGLKSDGTDLFSPAPVRKNYPYQAKTSRAGRGSYISRIAGESGDGVPKSYRLKRPHTVDTTDFDVIVPVVLGAKYSAKAHRFYDKNKQVFLRRRTKYNQARQQLAAHVDSLIKHVDMVALEAFLRAESEVQEMPAVWSLCYVDMLRQGIITFENLCCEFGNRMHTPLTNIATALRQFFTYGSQAYVLDIRCSQFVLASYLFEYPEQCFRLLTKSGAIDAAEVRYVLDELHTAYEADKKIRQFCADVRTKDLYAHTAEVLGLGARKKGKDLWFGAFFSATGECTAAKNQLRPLCGSLLDVTGQLNAPLERKDKEKRNLMPRLLQLLEQELMIGGVATRLLKLTDTPFFLVHDSVQSDQQVIRLAGEVLVGVYADADLPMAPYNIETIDADGKATKTLIETNATRSTDTDMAAKAAGGCTESLTRPQNTLHAKSGQSDNISGDESRPAAMLPQRAEGRAEQLYHDAGRPAANESIPEDFSSSVQLQEGLAGQYDEADNGLWQVPGPDYSRDLRAGPATSAGPDTVADAVALHEDAADGGGQLPDERQAFNLLGMVADAGFDDHMDIVDAGRPTAGPDPAEPTRKPETLVVQDPRVALLTENELAGYKAATFPEYYLDDIDEKRESQARAELVRRNNARQ